MRSTTLLHFSLLLGLLIYCHSLQSNHHTTPHPTPHHTTSYTTPVLCCRGDTDRHGQENSGQRPRQRQHTVPKHEVLRCVCVMCVCVLYRIRACISSPHVHRTVCLYCADSLCLTVLFCSIILFYNALFYSNLFFSPLSYSLYYIQFSSL